MLQEHKQKTANRGATSHEPTGRPVVFPLEWFDEVKEKLATMKTFAGFGTLHVAAIVTMVHSQKLGQEPGFVPFHPSPEWCRWFLKHIMKLSLRAVTSKVVERGSEVRDLLSEMLIFALAMDLKDGVLPCFMIAHDEFGNNFFPPTDKIWEEVGSPHVYCNGHDDKRQYTGCLSVAADGTLVNYQVIFEGKTERSLPSEVARNKFNKFEILYQTSLNHWSNVELKKALLASYAKYRDKKLMELVQNGFLFEPQKDTIKMVVILDCWPVNLSDELVNHVKQEYPWMVLRYIPAGATGKMQIGDAYFHRPFKHWMR